ncbi:TonB-dependent receptor domain-containing protein [Flavobacterium ponti]|uniref:TonB-dependent receptor domain-containing protein n=1 Tax=Flavobacterium ponti TaxID=665133 RepID=A0ABV9P068_9FLAO
MKKLFILFFFILSQLTFSQEEKLFSVEFKDSKITEVIKFIESETNYKFFFNQNWLIENEINLSKTFKNATLEDVLVETFKETNLNYFIDNNKIILTRNSIIYEKIPESEIKTTVVETKTISKNDPVFYQQYENKKSSSIILIGKETKNNSQSSYILSGVIKNEKTGEPIPSIVVRTLDKTKNAVTDDNGKYTLAIPAGLNEIEVVSLNYLGEYKKVMMYNHGKMDFSLTEKINQLDEVVLTGKEKQNINNVTSGVTTITSEEIKSVPMVLGERDILKVATIIPGIKSVGEGSSGFNVRGGKEDQNLFLLDDAVLYNPAHFFGFFSSINAYTIKSADIYKGSIPSQFGGRLSSVFDISTKNGNLEKLSGEGGIGPVTSNITVSTPVIKNKSSLLVGARATYSGWILRSLKESQLQNSKASFYDAIVKYNHIIDDKNELETTLYYSDDEFSISSDSIYHYNNTLATVKWKHKLNDKTNFSLNLSNSQYKFDIDYDNGLSNSFEYGYKINDTQLQLKFNTNLNETHKFNYGISTKHYKLDPGEIRPLGEQSIIDVKRVDREKALESGIFVNDQIKINERLTVNIGARYSYFASLGESLQNVYGDGLPKSEATIIETKAFKNNEVIKTYGGFEPRISARFKLTEDMAIKGSYDKTYQYLHLLSSNTTQSPLDTWKTSDLNVKPQNASQYSLGLYKNFKDNVYEVSVEGYFKKLNNILDYKVGAELVLNSNVETELLQGEGKAYGVEFLLKKQSGRLNGWIGYTYSRTFLKLDGQFNEEKVNNGEYFAANYDKPHDFSAILNYRFTKRYSFSANFIYQTGRPITYPVGTYQYGNANYTLYSDRNKFRIPDYYRMDIGFNIEGNHKLKKLAHSFWNISIYNVLGRNNPYSVFFVTDNGEIKAYKTSIFAIPIPTITYNFKF